MRGRARAFVAMLRVESSMSACILFGMVMRIAEDGKWTSESRQRITTRRFISAAFSYFYLYYLPSITWPIQFFHQSQYSLP